MQAEQKSSGVTAQASRWAWVFRMAYRDSRRSSRNLLLMLSSIAIGVAALVALQSLEENVERVIDEQAKPLLGADLLISSRTAFSEEAERFLASVGPVSSRQLSFASMAYFPKSKGSRLIQVYALSGDFPYYGEFETSPKTAVETYRAGNRALVESSLMVQFGVSPGDKVALGEHEFRIEGALKKVPGVVEMRSSVAPRVYIRLSDLEKTKLIQKGSRVRYGVYYSVKDKRDLEKWIKSHRKTLASFNLSADTVESRKESLGKSVRAIATFLDLIGFLSMILGGVGVGSALTVYLSRKRKTVALLRCLGARGIETAIIFLVQVLFFGSLGILIGAGAGVFLQQYLIAAVSQFLPVQVETVVSWNALVFGVSLGLLMLILFSITPLLSVLGVSPLNSLRLESSTTKRSRFWRALSSLLIVLGVSAFAILHTGNFYVGTIYSVSVLLSLYILGILGVLVRYLVKRYISNRIPFGIRQGLANLYRPQNQTLLLMRSIGMGVFLISLVLVSQHSILSKVTSLEEEGKPNTILFDVQSDQRNAVRKFLGTLKMPVIDDVPIISMRLHSIKGVSVKKLLADPLRGIPSWSLSREYRSTYRDSLVGSETTIEGVFIPEVKKHKGEAIKSGSDEVVPISVESGIAKRLKVRLGDSLVFNVQGILVETRIAHIRKVDWQRVQPNFFVVFPKGILESAPQFRVLVTRVDSEEQAAQFQRSAAEKFPTVSIIDLTLVLSTLNQILDQLVLVVRFLGSFCVLAAILVLITAVIGGRDQRFRENALLKTLGARKGVVIATITSEFFFLGTCAAISGIGLALGAGFVLSRYVFDSPFFPLLESVGLVGVLSVLTVVIIGFVASEGTYRKPALLVLRNDLEG